jgi:hypothetical protein
MPSKYFVACKDAKILTISGTPAVPVEAVQQLKAVSDEFRSVWSADGNEIWAAGDLLLFRSLNGGTTWQDEFSGLPDADSKISAVFGFATNEVYFCVYEALAGRKIVKWNGSSFSTIYTFAGGARPLSMWGTSGSNLYVGVDAGRAIRRWNGSTLEADTSTPLNLGEVVSMWGKDASNIYYNYHTWAGDYEVWKGSFGSWVNDYCNKQGLLEYVSTNRRC